MLLIVAAAAGTSSSLGRISGCGPAGVMLLEKDLSEQLSLVTEKSITYMRVDLPVTLGVMLLYVFKLRRLSKSWDIPIKVPQPLMYCRIAASYVADVAFEMLYIYWVEADNGRVESNVSLGDRRPKIIWFGMLGEMFLNMV